MRRIILFLVLTISMASMSLFAAEVLKETENYIETKNYTLRKAGKEKIVRVIESKKNTGIPDSEFSELLKYQTIRTITVYGGYPYTDKTAEIISKFQNVESLTISAGKLTDNGLVYIGKMKTIDVLTLEDMVITDKGIENLSALSNLKEINLKNTLITDKAFETFSKMKNVYYFDLTGTKVTKDAAKVFYEKRRKELPNSNVHIFVTGFEFY